MEHSQKKSIKDQVYIELQNQIVIGELQPKERLVELDLAKQFKCSQAPIREALQKLSEEGLVETIPYTGAFVADISYEEIKELFEYRRLIELNALKKSFHLLSKRDLDILKSIIDEMRKAARKRDIGALVSNDMFFHRYIVEKAGKKVSFKLWSRIDLHVRRFIAHTHPKYFDDLEEIAKAHEPLLSFLQEGDLTQAKEEFLKHINIEEIADALEIQ